jgi:hypothetical protein
MRDVIGKADALLELADAQRKCWITFADQGEQDERSMMPASPQLPDLWSTVKTYRLPLVNITPTDSIVHTSLTSDEHPLKWRSTAKGGPSPPAFKAKTMHSVRLALTLCDSGRIAAAKLLR